MYLTFSKATQAHPEHAESNEDYLAIDRQHGLAVPFFDLADEPSALTAHCAYYLGSSY